MGYLANHVDVNPKRYTRKRRDAFTLFETPFAGKAEIADQIARYILAGERSKALSLIRDNPSCHECIAGASDDLGRYAEGTPLGLAAAAGNPELVTGIICCFFTDGARQSFWKEIKIHREFLKDHIPQTAHVGVHDGVYDPGHPQAANLKWAFLHLMRDTVL